MTFVSLRKRSTSLNILAVVLVVFIIANLVFIWVNSAKAASSSNKESKKIAETIVKKTTKDYNNLPKSEQQKKISKTNIKIRSMAHFAEFIPLGFFMFLLVYNLFCSKKRRYLMLTNMILAVTACALCALSDEIHQIFIKGRTFEVKDIGIDTLGSVVGICIAHTGLLVRHVFQQTHSKK